MNEREIYEKLGKLEEAERTHTKAIEILSDKVDNLELSIARYRGLVGGVLLGVTAIITAIKFLWDYLVAIVSKITGG